MTDQLYERTRLTNRPFLMISIIQRPASGVNTSIKGWNKVTGNFSMFERTKIKDRVSAKDMAENSVILDIIHGKVVKAALERPEDEIVDYYLGKYKAECKQAVDRWISAQAANFMKNEGKRIIAEQAAVEPTTTTDV